MIPLKPIIERINALVAEDSDASVTYAALEARLALEKVCYDRLRERHDYISHAQLRKWQPGSVVTTLMQEVDPYLGQTMTLSIGSPVSDGIRPQDDEFTEIGTEMGFNSRRIAKLWQALANLALHVRLPEHRDDYIPAYGDKDMIRAKVEEVVAELERLSKGTMTFSGIPIGGEVSFECSCGEKNRCRAATLSDGKHIPCINPECKQTWKVSRKEHGFGFEQVTVPVNCEQCKEANHMPWRFFLDMKPDQTGKFSCYQCGHKNYIRWKLMQVAPTKTS